MGSKGLDVSGTDDAAERVFNFQLLRDLDEALRDCPNIGAAVDLSLHPLIESLRKRNTDGSFVGEVDLVIAVALSAIKKRFVVAERLVPTFERDFTNALILELLPPKAHSSLRSVHFVDENVRENLRVVGFPDDVIEPEPPILRQLDLPFPESKSSS